MNYPPLKFKATGGPLDGEDWILGKAKPEVILRDGLTFNLIRRDEEGNPIRINAKYKVEFDQEKKTYSATFVEPNE